MNEKISLSSSESLTSPFPFQSHSTREREDDRSDFLNVLGEYIDSGQENQSGRIHQSEEIHDKNPKSLKERDSLLKSESKSGNEDLTENNIVEDNQKKDKSKDKIQGEVSFVLAQGRFLNHLKKEVGMEPWQVLAFSRQWNQWQKEGFSDIHNSSDEKWNKIIDSLALSPQKRKLAHELFKEWTKVIPLDLEALRTLSTFSISNDRTNISQHFKESIKEAKKTPSKTFSHTTTHLADKNDVTSNKTSHERNDLMTLVGQNDLSDSPWKSEMNGGEKKSTFKVINNEIKNEDPSFFRLNHVKQNLHKDPSLELDFTQQKLTPHSDRILFGNLADKTTQKGAEDKRRIFSLLNLDKKNRALKNEALSIPFEGKDEGKERLNSLFSPTSLKEISEMNEMEKDLSQKGNHFEREHKREKDLYFRSPVTSSGSPYVQPSVFNSNSSHSIQSLFSSEGSSLEGLSPKSMVLNQDKILEHIQFLSQKPEGGEIRFRLEPEGLGEIFLQVKDINNKIYVKMLTENAEAKKILQDGISGLREALALKQVKVDQIHVDKGAHFLDSEWNKNHFQNRGDENQNSFFSSHSFNEGKKDSQDDFDEAFLPFSDSQSLKTNQETKQKWNNLNGKNQIEGISKHPSVYNLDHNLKVLDLRV